MIKAIFAAVASLSVCIPAQATSWTDVKTLVELVEGTGTTVSVVNDCPDHVLGSYTFDGENDIDLMVICKNNIDTEDPDEVWEVVAHEATHTMQACMGEPVLDDRYIPRVLRELQETAPHYYQILQTYSGAHKRVEIEAFWMELRAPEDVFTFFRNTCYNA